uniref:Uncharacterized protein n=1 Tax=Rhizophora mucronata TaxID=61149 RepID=A0A2P2P2C0_RHIMU
MERSGFMIRPSMQLLKIQNAMRYELSKRTWPLFIYFTYPVLMSIILKLEVIRCNYFATENEL